MTQLKSIIYPPNEIFNPLSDPNYDYLILWMLENNDFCTWSDLTKIVAESTLYDHIQKLEKLGLISHPKRDYYTITTSGKTKFMQLSKNSSSNYKTLNYPPKSILKRRNYDLWILWMLYNNEYCIWSDFRSEPLGINQSSLSKTLRILLNAELILKKDKKYVISFKGSVEYEKIIELYGLDRYSLLKNESERVKDIARELSFFFGKNVIQNNTIKYRLLDYILKMDYDSVRKLIKRKEDFFKILLFISINHPTEYPYFISIENFSLKYKINFNFLTYFLEEFISGELFQIMFLMLPVLEDCTYYLQVGGKVEKILRAITVDTLKKRIYISKFYGNESENIDLEEIIETIVDEASERIINPKFKNTLTKIMPEYIRYLSSEDKIKGKISTSDERIDKLIFQDFYDAFEEYSKHDLDELTNQNNKHYDRKIYE